MNLFHYPKSKHTRTQTPYPYKNYSDYKPSLRIEFAKTCVYCRTPDNLSEKNYYAVEHYKPKSIFPQLETEYTNLYYSCGHCNSKKGEFWPTDNELRLGIFIPNPCDHVMFQHLRTLTNCIVAHHSHAGEWTIDLLDLNSPKKIQKRNFYTDLYKDAKTKIVQCNKVLTALESKILNQDTQEQSNINNKYQQAKANFDKINSIIQFIEDDNPE